MYVECYRRSSILIKQTNSFREEKKIDLKKWSGSNINKQSKLFDDEEEGSEKAKKDEKTKNIFLMEDGQ